MDENVARLVPEDIRAKYEVHEWRNALPILKTTHAAEWADILGLLSWFRLLKQDILKKGEGNKSPVAKKLDGWLYERGWVEKAFDTRINVDQVEYVTPTHGVDCFRNRVALEVEWNNKDPFYDRDLNNFRLLFDLRVIDVGVIVTRKDELQEIFNVLGKGRSYGASTTHMSKLLPRIEGGGGGGCPILVFGISRRLYDERG
jgi:hypothetical protein